MSTFFHPITFVGSQGQREIIDALVDTGATFTSLPRQRLEGLGVRPTRQVRLRLAGGRRHVQDLGRVMIELAGMEEVTYVVFAEEGSPPSIGAITLESLLLGVDPVEQRLVPVDGWQA